MKKLVTILTVLVMVLSIVPAMAEQPVKITVWSAEDGANMREYLQAFSEAYPQYEADITFYQDDELKEQLTIAISAGTAPTVIRAKVGSQLNDYVAAGTLLPLNQYAEEYGWYDMMYDDIRAALTYDGNLYEVPIKTGGNWGVLYYNADMAAELGIDLSETITVDDLIAMKDVVEAAGYQLLSFGNVDRWPGLILMGDYMMQAATPALIDGLNKGTIKWNESPEVLKTFETLQKLGTSDVFLTGYASSDHISVNQTWAAGRTLFMYCGTWWPATVADGLDGVPFEIHTITLPLIDEDTVQQGQQFFANGGIGINVNATPEQAEAAAAYLDYNWGIEGQKVMFSDFHSYQANKMFNDNLAEYGCEILDLFKEEPFLKQMDLPQMNYADWAFDTVVVEALKDRVVDLFAGTMTPQEAADAIQMVADEANE